MTIRKKTMLIIGVTGISLLLIFSVISYFIVLKSFTKIEAQHVQEHLQRTLRLINDDLDTLSKTLGDWAVWTATYNFMAGTYPEYIAENLMNTTFITLKIHFMLFIDNGGTIAFGKAVDLEAEREMSLPVSLKTALLPENPLLHHPDKTSVKTGILNLPEGPLLIAACPILTSEGEDPARGILLIGRYLDASGFERLAQLTNLSISLWQVNDNQLPPDVRSVLELLYKITQELLSLSTTILSLDTRL